tara:strand:+ start:832 stop:2331 length:1500 start_codon:yes stop_codon:yes gene_type:complete
MKSEKHKITNLLKLGLFLFLIPLILFNCEREEESFIETTQNRYKTVSFEKAKLIIKNISPVNLKMKTENEEGLSIIPEWSTLIQDEIEGVDALLTNVVAEVTSLTNIELSTKLVFLEYNEHTYSAIETSEVLDFYDDGSIKNGNVYYHVFTGTYLDGYVIDDGIITKRLVKATDTENSTANRIVGGNNTENDECDEDLIQGSEFCSNTLDEFDLTDEGNGDSSNPSPLIFMIHSNEDNPELVDLEDGGANGGSGGSGNNDGTNNSCTNGKVDDGNGNCVCPSGFVEDSVGNCVNPCDEIGNHLTDSNVASNMQILRNGLNGTAETGFVQGANGSFSPMQLSNNGHALRFGRIGGNLGYMHSHTNPYRDSNGEWQYPVNIFSPSDMIAFLTMLKNIPTGYNQSEVYATVVTPNGTYTLRFSGSVNDIPSLGVFNVDNLSLLFVTEMEGITRSGATEEKFLNFLNTHFNINGINLYKVNTNNNTTSLLTLDNNGDVDQNPC